LTKRSFFMTQLDRSLRARPLRFRRVGPLVAAATVAAAAGCTAAHDGEHAVTDDSAEIRGLSGAEIVGSIALGETSPVIAYTNPPRYRALSFRGTAGAVVDAWVRSTDGDAVAWLTTSSFKSLAANDDASADTTDAHLTATLPTSDTYYVVFRERDLESSHFTVSLAGASGGACAGGGKTRLVGRVFDPAGANALQHVLVYVPKDGAALPPISITDPQPVDALARTTTDALAKFVLDDVPAKNPLPVVVQRGKWRRQLNVELTNLCGDNAVEDGTLRLPRSGSEGDLPQIAVTTGGADAFECFIRGIGVDESEFVNGHDASGHIHLFKGELGKLGPDASELWSDAATLKKYDATLLSCEGTETLRNKTAAALDAMHTYLDAGGRVLADHYEYVWFMSSPHADFQQVATWGSSAMGSTGPYDIVTSFPSGKSLWTWLAGTGSIPAGQISLSGVTRSVASVSSLVQPWIQRAGEAPKLFTFDTPLGAPKTPRRGRVAFTDFHAESSGSKSSLGQCSTQPGSLNPQQRALEYVLFDLTSALGD
jgi:hypothetical protein